MTEMLGLENINKKNIYIVLLKVCPSETSFWLVEGNWWKHETLKTMDPWLQYGFGNLEHKDRRD